MKKNEKGSISLYVLVAMLFFLIFAITTYVRISNERVIQLKATSRIKEIYEQDVNIPEEIYNKII